MKQYPRKRVQYVTQLAAQQVNPEQLGDDLVLHYSIPSLQEIGKATKEPASDIASNKWLLEGGEVLISKLNVHKNCIAIADKTDEHPIVASTEFVPLRPVNVNPRFLAYVFQSVETIELLTSFSESATRSHARVNPSDIIKLKIPQPSIETQRRIADYLDRETARIDALVAEKEKMLALLEEKRTALISRAVTRGLDPNVPLKPSGLDWLGDIPAHWELKKLKHIASLKSGETITADSISDTEDYPVYGGNGLRGFTSGFTHSGDYVLIGRQGALCGNVNYASGRFWASEHAIVVALKSGYNVFWLGELMRVMNLNQYSQSAAQPGISVDVIENLKIPVPLITEQNDIAALIKREYERINTIEGEIEQSINLLKERRAALITAAVTGQLDLEERAA